MMSSEVLIVLAVVLGAIVGVAADRISARWPLHEDAMIRGLDWRSLVVVIAGGASFGALTARWTEPADLLILGIYVAALIVLLATDLDQKLLPDLITLPLIVYAAAVTLLGLNPVLADKSPLFFVDGGLSAAPGRHPGAGPAGHLGPRLPRRTGHG